MPDLGIKRKVDSYKKKILISQTRKDKALSDLVYNFLLFNSFPAEEILYSNCDSHLSRIPDDVPIFDYLRDFFVNSYSDQKIFVFFITSENIISSFGTMAEIGAAWITQIDHRIFNINEFQPNKPLNNDRTWHTTKIDAEGKISMDTINADIFCKRIAEICTYFGYVPKDDETNMTYLKSQIEILSNA